MDSQVLWQVILGTSASALIIDFVVGLAKKSPPFLIAPYIRLWKESALLLRVLRNKDFSQWKPQAARYVALRAIKAQGANQESSQPVLDMLESFLERSEPILLLGEPGAGKSTALEALTYRLAGRALLYDCLIWLALLLVTAVLSFAAPVFTLVWLASFILWEPLVRRFTVPLFIEARSDEFGGDVNEWCEKILKDRLGAKPLIGSRRRVALFIDGVNEVEGSRYGGFVEGWRARLRDKRACRVILTSRGGEENPAESLSVENVLSVCDLDDDGVREFLKVYGREKAVEEKKPYNAEQAKRDFDELQKKNLLGEGSIGRNPYWLKMIGESGLYTVNRGALFYSFAEKLIRREIKVKPKKRERDPEWNTVPLKVEMEALAALALAMHEEKRVGFSDEAGWDKAWDTIEEILRHSPYKPQDVLGEAQASTLLRVQFKKRVEFVHQIVQEFFAAYALHPESKWQEVLAHCEDVWWGQTLFHIGGLVGAQKSAQPYSELVREVLGDGSNEQRVFAAIGLLRSVENAPSELSSIVIEAFGGLMEKNLILREGATTLNLTEAQERALNELTRTLGEEATDAFALLPENSRLEIQVIGILILGIVGSRHAAELIVRKLNDSIYGFIGITPLVRIGAPAVEPLIAALREKRRVVRGRAAEALGLIGDGRAVEPLIAALRDENEDVRVSAGDALVKIGALAVERIIAALRDEDTDVRWRAAYALGHIGDARAVEPLIAALRDEDTSVPWRAAYALGQIGDARAVEPLIAAVRDEDTGVRRRAVYALGKVGDTRAVEPLIAALRDQDTAVRRYAVEALGQMGDARAVEPLIAVLQDEEDVRRRAADALGHIGDPRAVEPLITALRDKEIGWYASHALVKIGAPSVEPLMTALRDEDADVRWRAGHALGEIGDARAVEPLITALRDKEIGRYADHLVKIGVPSVEPLMAALRDEDESVRWQVAVALRQIGDARAVEPLIAALRDENEEVRWHVALALRQIGDARAVVPLIAALRDENRDVRYCAADALGQIGDARAVEPLTAALRDQNTGVRKSAVDAMRQIGNTRAIEPLIAALRDENGDVRYCATKALVEIGSPSVEPLIGALRDKNRDVRSSAAEALGLIGDGRAVEPLIAALRDENEDVRVSAGDALGQIGDARAVEPLVAALRDENEDTAVRSHAASALARIGGARAVEPLIATLRDENKDVRSGVAYSLARIGGARAVEPLIATLRDENEDVRSGVAYALVEIGAPSVEPLISALRDKNRDVRSSAADTLGKISDDRAFQPLIAALRDEDDVVRRCLPYALARIGGARAVEPLNVALRDRDSWVRRLAADALGKIGDARAVEPLIAALRDENRDVQAQASGALGEIGDPRAVEPLMVVLRTELARREKAAEALVKIGAPSVEPLIAALHDEVTEVRWFAAEVRWFAAYALGKIGDVRALDELERIAQEDKSITTGGVSVAHKAREAAEKIRQRHQGETKKKE